MHSHPECFRAVQVTHRVAGSLLYRRFGLEVVVVDGLFLEVFPVALDEVQFRGVGGVPDHSQLAPVVSQEALNVLGVMNRAVVQEEENVAPSMSAQQQFQVCPKRHTVFRRCGVCQQVPGQGVKGAEHGQALILSCGRNERLPPPTRPHAAQAGIEMEFALVLEEKHVAVWMAPTFFRPRLAGGVRGAQRRVFAGAADSTWAAHRNSPAGARRG